MGVGWRFRGWLSLRSWRDFLGYFFLKTGREWGNSDVGGGGWHFPTDSPHPNPQPPRQYFITRSQSYKKCQLHRLWFAWGWRFPHLVWRAFCRAPAHSTLSGNCSPAGHSYVHYPWVVACCRFVCVSSGPDHKFWNIGPSWTKGCTLRQHLQKRRTMLLTLCSVLCEINVSIK